MDLPKVSGFHEGALFPRWALLSDPPESGGWQEPENHCEYDLLSCL